MIIPEEKGVSSWMPQKLKEDIMDQTVNKYILF